MKKQFVEIRLEVPVDSIDFSECGDGCGLVTGLAMAKFKGYSIFEFDDTAVATAEMCRQLGEDVSEPQAAASEASPYHYDPQETYRQARREALDGDLISRNRGI